MHTINQYWITDGDTFDFTPAKRHVTLYFDCRKSIYERLAEIGEAEVCPRLHIPHCEGLRLRKAEGGLLVYAVYSVGSTLHTTSHYFPGMANPVSIEVKDDV